MIISSQIGGFEEMIAQARNGISERNESKSWDEKVQNRTIDC